MRMLTLVKTPWCEASLEVQWLGIPCKVGDTGLILVGKIADAMGQLR